MKVGGLISKLKWAEDTKIMMTCHFKKDNVDVNGV